MLLRAPLRGVRPVGPARSVGTASRVLYTPITALTAAHHTPRPSHSLGANWSALLRYYPRTYCTSNETPKFNPEHYKIVYDEVTLTKYQNNPVHQKVEKCEPRFGITKDIFLQKIGKDCDKYAHLFKDWDDLMYSKSRSLRDRGIPVKQRRWILQWVEKYKQGIEPYAIRLKSIAKKNKAKRDEMRAAHKANLQKHLEKKKKLREAKRLWKQQEAARLQQLTQQQQSGQVTAQPQQEDETQQQEEK